MDIMKKNEAVSKEFLDWIVAETRALNSSEWNIFGKCKLSFARDGRTIILPEAITISWSWSRFVSYRRRNIGPFQFYEKRLKVVIMIQPTLTKMTWALECVTCNFFWYLCCFRQGFIRVTLRNKKNIGLIWFMSISSSDFWLLCCTNYTLQLQGKNGQNKPENPQNWNMAKIAPKSDKFTK